MPKRIGIFAPGFSAVGHHISFNQYIAEMLGDDFELVFLDSGNTMQSAYEGKLTFKHPHSFVTVADEPEYPGRLSLKTVFSISWWRKRIAELAWAGKAFKNIDKLGLDLVIITSQNTPLIFLQNPRFPFCIVVQNSLLINAKQGLSGLRRVFVPVYDFFIKKYFSFLKKAGVVFTTNEATLPFPFPGAVWLPTNLALKSFGQDKVPVKRKFLTIGIISETKNHLFAIDAFEKYQLPFSYLIAGIPKDAVGREVQQRVEHSVNPRLTGIFENIPTDKYESLIKESDYMILPYDFKGGSRGASQVLYDAFRNLTPIVAPDIEPFKTYVERYGVGLLYAEGNASSFKTTVEKAARSNKGHFLKNYERLYEDFSFDKIKMGFLAHIRLCLT